MAEEQYDSFDALRNRLDDIVQAVGDPAIPLDDALALYEEAVKLGMLACDMAELEDAADGVPVPAERPSDAGPAADLSA